MSSPPRTHARLIPRWYTALVVLLLGLGLAVGIAGFMLEHGPLPWTLGFLGGASLLLLVAAVRSLVLTRRRRDLPSDEQGAVVFRAPGLIVWPLVIAFLLVMPLGALWLYLLITDIDSVDSPGAGFAVVVGAIAAIPDLVRLLTGRLHRWELRLDPEGYRYRGFRTEQSRRWSQVHGAEIQTRRPAGVRIDLKGTGPDLVVPIAAFDVPAEQIVEEIEKRISASRR